MKYWLLLALLTGCSTYELRPPEPGEDEWKPSTALPMPAGAKAEDGSLYRRDYMFTLFQDRRAYRVGDILTVMLDERTQSSKKADTSMGKNSSINVPTPSIGGVAHDDLGLDMSAKRAFDGSATASQQNTLSGPSL